MGERTFTPTQEALLALDAQLNRYKKEFVRVDHGSSIQTRIDGPPVYFSGSRTVLRTEWRIAHEYTRAQMLVRDYGAMREAVCEEELLIRPSSGGFEPKFRVCLYEQAFPGVSPEPIVLLRFRESQLPKNHRFCDLEDMMTSPRALELTKFYGLKPVNSRAYTY